MCGLSSAEEVDCIFVGQTYLNVTFLILSFSVFRPVSHLLKAMTLQLSLLAEGNAGCLPVSSAQVLLFH